MGRKWRHIKHLSDLDYPCPTCHACVPYCTMGGRATALATSTDAAVGQR
jgi:hypothetical protein